MWEIANSGHIDALMVALMMTGLWLAASGKTLRGVAAISFGALAKPFAVLALPACWRPWNWRAPALSIAIAAASYVFYLSAGTGVLGFLPRYLHEEHTIDGDDNWLLTLWRSLAGAHPADASVYLVLAGLVLGGLALAAALRSERTPQTILDDTGRLLLVFLLLLSPRYPWYFLAITPFVALRGDAVLWAASIGSLLLQDELDWDVYVPLFIRQTALYGAVAVALIWSMWSRRQFGGTPKPPGATGHVLAS
jgi:hypothetical protein